MIRKVMIVGIIIMLLIIWQSVSLYFSVVDNKNSPLLAATRQMEQEGIRIEKVDRFHGDQLYIMTKSQDDEGKEWYIASTQEGKVDQIAVQEIKLAEEAVIQAVKNQFSEIQEIQRIHPAYSQKEFSWEVIGIDEKNMMHYIYFRMRDGSFQKRYVLSH
ncbi:hypothetical protein [Caldalkalibacillus mannanilyticus]|uniref:hypothetical protein n=1 Tax=Caldalkalibacillus mannanilyticus TaxID=1418 RepID=UPI0004699123|nr:hypothetical protein [Caldalkalibacillus mannanilyticus]